MCLPPANARICQNPLLYSAVYHRYSLKSFQLCKSAQTNWYRKYFEHIVARFQGDSSCLTIDNIKPELCRNSRHCIIRCLLLAIPPRYFSIQAISTAMITNFIKFFNPLSRVLKENINKIYKCSILAPLEMLLTSFSKHSVLIPRGQSVSAVTGGVEYFREDRQHIACDNSEPKLT